MTFKQSDILTSAANNSAIWMYKVGEEYKFTNVKPIPCSSMRDDNCGVYLKGVNDLDTYLTGIDTYIKTEFRMSQGHHKIYLLLSDVESFSRVSNSAPTSTSYIKSRLVHSEILIGTSLVNDTYCISYRMGDEDKYPSPKKFYSWRQNGWSQSWNGKCYGLVYLGHYSTSQYPMIEDLPPATPIEGENAVSNPDLCIICAQNIIEEEADNTSNIHIRCQPDALTLKIFRIVQYHQLPHYLNEKLTKIRDNSPVNSDDPCTLHDGIPFTMNDIFRLHLYSPLYLNCQHICLAFMYILKCSRYFSPVFKPRPAGRSGQRQVDTANLDIDITNYPSRLSNTPSLFKTFLEGDGVPRFTKKSVGDGGGFQTPKNSRRRKKVMTTMRKIKKKIYNKRTSKRRSKRRSKRTSKRTSKRIRKRTSKRIRKRTSKRTSKRIRKKGERL